MRYLPENQVMRVGIVGVNPYTRLVVGAYAGLPNVAVTALCDADATKVKTVAAQCKVAGVFTDLDKMLASDEVNAIEIHAPAERHREIVAAACQHGIHVAIHKPLAATGDAAKAIIADIRQAGIASVVLDLLLFHPLVREAKAKLADELVGEVQLLRLKSQAGCDDKGAACDPAVFADPNRNPLVMAQFDKTAIAEYLLGPIAEVFAYAGASCRMVSFKFAAPGCYGFHEAVCSPGLAVQSAVAPVDHSLEITGTDGILWVRNLTATLVETPRLMLKRKSQTTVWDDRVEYEIPSVLAQMRAHFVAVARGKAKPHHAIEDAARALAINEAAAVSIRESRPVRTI